MTQNYSSSFPPIRFSQFFRSFRSFRSAQSSLVFRIFQAFRAFPCAIAFLFLAFLFFGSTEAGAVPLATLIDRALADNLSLKMENLRIEEQAFDEKKADNALIPNLRGNFNHQRQSYVDPSPAAFFGTEFYQTIFAFELVQHYPALGKIPRIERDVARLKTQYQKTLSERAAVELRRKVVNLYFDLLEERELAKVDEENILLLLQLLEVAKINRDVGLALPNDILRIEAQKANLESSRTTRGFQQENIRIDIANLLNLKTPTDVEIDLPPSLVFPLVQLNKEHLLDSLMKTDQDLELARQDVALVRLAVEGARSAHLPTLNLDGKYNVTNAKDGFRNARDYGVSMSLDFPIFDSGDIRNDLSKTRRMMTRLELALQDLTNTRKAALNKAWTDYQEMFPKLRFAEVAVGQSFENMRMVVTRYRHGDANIVELADAQITLSDAAQEAVKIHHDERIRLAELYVLSQNHTALRSVDSGAVHIPKMDIDAFEKAPVPSEDGNLVPEILFSKISKMFSNDADINPIFHMIKTTTELVNAPFKPENLR
ncbi:MAG: TolC family protein [Candidatus Ozemobacteraceae bacterium]